MNQSIHPLRPYNRDNSLSDQELDFFLPYFDKWEDWEHFVFSGNFNITTDKAAHKEWLSCLCCGVYEEEFNHLSRPIYIAFDYGH